MKACEMIYDTVPEYVVAFDWENHYKPMTIDLEPLKATDLFSAMEEAENKWTDEVEENLWCMSIYSKSSDNGNEVSYRECLTSFRKCLWARDPDQKETCIYSKLSHKLHW